VGEVQVYYNLCRHRGARLVAEPCSAKRGRIVCPYHAWSFDLAGELLFAPHFYRDAEKRQPDTEARAHLGLIPVRSAVWRDVVFADLSGEAQPFEEFIRPLDERLAPWTGEDLRPLAADEYVVEANWKLAAENFLDGYHLPVVHSQLGSSFSGALASEDIQVSDEILGISMLDGYGQDSGLEETGLPRFSGLEDGNDRIEVFSVFPNTLILVEPEFQQVIVLRPQAAGVTEETFANYVATDASQADDLKDIRREMHRDSVEVNDQDAVLLAGLQQSRSMDVGGQTVLSEVWDRTVRRFQRLWAERLLARL
jgi:phenylpropionate dioxygenase-like ring-hydroxylating dioxygenase large terminal subunit